jgi:hypothetical protein
MQLQGLLTTVQILSLLISERHLLISSLVNCVCILFLSQFGTLPLLEGSVPVVNAVSLGQGHEWEEATAPYI